MMKKVFSFSLAFIAPFQVLGACLNNDAYSSTGTAWGAGPSGTCFTSGNWGYVNGPYTLTNPSCGGFAVQYAGGNNCKNPLTVGQGQFCIIGKYINITLSFTYPVAATKVAFCIGSNTNPTPCGTNGAGQMQIITTSNTGQFFNWFGPIVNKGAVVGGVIPNPYYISFILDINCYGSSYSPTRSPTMSPTTSAPSVSPTKSPTTSTPSVSPTKSPTTSTPSVSPTDSPTTSTPTISPTNFPTTLSPVPSCTDAGTAYARSASAVCFSGNNWGFNNGPYSSASSFCENDIPLIAGAGQCSLTAGTTVGTVTYCFNTGSPETFSIDITFTGNYKASNVAFCLGPLPPAPDACPSGGAGHTQQVFTTGYTGSTFHWDGPLDDWGGVSGGVAPDSFYVQIHLAMVQGTC
jgi:hypothetical protein